ncbi:MAG: LacI family transcriptional regulator, partial [Lentisphaerae bacterium]|nr:LacI family transcriptional regulator [Lentisphaerota bacterium]
DTRCDLISTDRFHESQHLCKLLLSRGVTRIGMMLPVIDQIICDGIRCCLEHHGLELRNDDIRFVPNTTLNNYVQPLYDLLDSGDWPDALIFPCVAPVDLCDQLCRHRGLVMTDLTLPVSFSDHGIVDRPFPLIYYNTPEMCRLAVEWLHRKIRHPERQPCRLAVPMIYPEDLGNTTAGDALSRPHMATGPHP